jgi:hypothetical protein
VPVGPTPGLVAKDEGGATCMSRWHGEGCVNAYRAGMWSCVDNVDVSHDTLVGRAASPPHFWVTYAPCPCPCTV